MSTPYDLVSAVELARPADKAELFRLTRALEAEAAANPPTQIRAALQDVRYVSAATREVFADLASRQAQVVMFARGLPSYLAAGVRGVDLDEDDPLVDQWCVVLAGGPLPVVLAATDLRVTGVADMARSFSYAVSRDPLVVQACLAALTR